MNDIKFQLQYYYSDIHRIQMEIFFPESDTMMNSCRMEKFHINLMYADSGIRWTEKQKSFINTMNEKSGK